MGDDPIRQVAAIADARESHIFRIDKIIPSDGVVHTGHDVPEIASCQIADHSIRKCPYNGPCNKDRMAEKKRLI